MFAIRISAKQITSVSRAELIIQRGVSSSVKYYKPIDRVSQILNWHYFIELSGADFSWFHNTQFGRC